VTGPHVRSEAPRSGAESPVLPLAVQIGFTGTRRLAADGTRDTEILERSVAALLVQELTTLRRELRLGEQHFIVGVSQLAAGADTAFTEALSTLGWGQRVLLPQPRCDFLAGEGSAGPDFTAAQRENALALLARPHIVEERVVSTAANRGARFDEVSLEILAESDVLIRLLCEERPGRLGGSAQMVQRAAARRIPVLELRLLFDAEGAPRFERQWIGSDGVATGTGPAYARPILPALATVEPLRLPATGAPWPDPCEYALRLKEAASPRAGEQRSDFDWAAFVIVGTHVAATLIASMLMVKLIGGDLAKVALLAELGLLCFGLHVHHRLHHEGHTEAWALARLCAEVSRSMRAAARLPGAVAYLRRLALPTELHPLLRTFELLHLRSVRDAPAADWQGELHRYRRERLEDPDPRKGQVAYYVDKQKRARRLRDWTGWLFTGASVLAIAATAAKLVFKASPQTWGAGPEWLGIAAVLLPVAAVGLLSIAAARDAHARADIYKNMVGVLARQQQLLAGAKSAREAAALIGETESRLLEENLQWYARRKYTGVT
jgi:hypothetical protein